MYCKPELPQAFRTLILPIASIITPNQYEAELLAGMPIICERDAFNACSMLHSKGPHTVIITSLNVERNWVTIVASTTIEQEHTGQLRATAANGSSATEITVNNTYTRYKVRVPRVDGYFTGTGDLFSALLLGWMHRHPENLKLALEHAVAGLQTVLVDTVKYASTHGGGAEEQERTSKVWAARELRLIQNQEALAKPESIIYKAMSCEEPWPLDTC